MKVHLAYLWWQTFTDSYCSIVI